MIENILHYIWLYKKIDILQLQTTQLEPLEVISVGFPNPNSGPDFFNGQLRIGEHLWVGNIEIHIKSSDWYIHNHQNDKAYDNVILHVVYEHDVEIYRHNNSVIPTLELRGYIDSNLLESYNKLLTKEERWINCESDIHSILKLEWNKWIERLYFERLYERSKRIDVLVGKTKTNWEAVLFSLLAQSFGSKVNGDAFFSISRSFDFSIIQKLRSKPLDIEALLLGQAGLLDKVYDVPYYKELHDAYKYLKQKYQLESTGVEEVKFFRLRPNNFPTIRLSQLASLYATRSKLFSKIIEIDNVLDYYELFNVEVSKFWKSHYTFKKSSKLKNKYVTKNFIDLVLINTIIPLKFFYARYKGLDISEHITQLMSSITSENNTIIENFKALNIRSPNAMTSQGLIQLKTVYCDHNRCLKCAVGHALLSK